MERLKTGSLVNSEDRLFVSDQGSGSTGGFFNELLLNINCTKFKSGEGLIEILNQLILKFGVETKILCLAIQMGQQQFAM